MIHGWDVPRSGTSSTGVLLKCDPSPPDLDQKEPHENAGARVIGETLRRCQSPFGRRDRLRALTVTDAADGPEGAVLHMPAVRSVLWHAVPVVLESVVAPLAAYYSLFLVAGFRGALFGALAWSFLIMARRLVRRERVSTLLLLTMALLSLRTLVSLLTGSAFLYFIQPTASMFLGSFFLLCSALLGRPFTQRFTHDFWPLAPELLARPGVRRFFVRVSYLWSLTMLLNGAVVLWLLLTVSVAAFPIERGAISVSLIAAAVFCSVMWFAHSMRRDGVTVRFGGGSGLAATST